MDWLFEIKLSLEKKILGVKLDSCLYVREGFPIPDMSPYIIIAFESLDINRDGRTLIIQRLPLDIVWCLFLVKQNFRDSKI